MRVYVQKPSNLIGTVTSPSMSRMAEALMKASWTGSGRSKMLKVTEKSRAVVPDPMEKCSLLPFPMKALSRKRSYVNLSTSIVPLVGLRRVISKTTVKSPSMDPGRISVTRTLSTSRESAAL